MPRKHARPAARKKRKAIQAAMPERPRGFAPPAIVPHFQRGDHFARYLPPQYPSLKAYEEDPHWSVLGHQLDPANEFDPEAAFLAGRQCGKTDMMTEALKQALAEGMAMVEIDPRRFPPGRLVEVDGETMVEITVPAGGTLGGRSTTLATAESGIEATVRFDRAGQDGDRTSYTVMQDGKIIGEGEL